MLVLISVYTLLYKLTLNNLEYNTIQYNTIQYNTIQYNTINTIQYDQYNTIRYNTIQYDTLRYNTIHYDTIRYNTIQYDTIRYNTIQYSGILCFRRESGTKTKVFPFLYFRSFSDRFFGLVLKLRICSQRSYLKTILFRITPVWYRVYWNANQKRILSTASTYMNSVMETYGLTVLNKIVPTFILC